MSGQQRSKGVKKKEEGQRFFLILFYSNYNHIYCLPYQFHNERLQQLDADCRHLKSLIHFKSVPSGLFIMILPFLAKI